MMANSPTYRRSITSTGIAALLALGSSNLLASGFALIEQSVSSMGTAYAGAGSAAIDSSQIFFNPASMSRLEGRQASAGLHIVLPNTEFNPSPTSVTGAEYTIAAGALAGTPIPGNDGGDAGTTGAVPHASYVMDLNDQWKFGLSLNVPFGLATEYDAGWVGRFSAIESEITAININPMLSYQVNDKTTVGIGVSAMHATLELINAVDDPVLSMGALTSEAIADLDVDDWGFGFNLGLLLEPNPNTRFGIAYRSEVKVELDGDLTTTSGVQPSTSAAVDADLPATLLLSAYHDVNDRWAVMADILWTGWDSIDGLVARFGTGNTNTIPLDFDNSWRYAVGASYRKNDHWTLRGGIAFDETPVQSPTFRPAALPDEDRLWVTLGATLEYSKNITFDFGYAHLFIDDTTINSSSAISSLAPVQSIGLHELDGNYDASVDILSAQVNWYFN